MISDSTSSYGTVFNVLSDVHKNHTKHNRYQVQPISRSTLAAHFDTTGLLVESESEQELRHDLVRVLNLQFQLRQSVQCQRSVAPVNENEVHEDVALESLVAQKRIVQQTQSVELLLA